MHVNFHTSLLVTAKNTLCRKYDEYTGPLKTQ